MMASGTHEQLLHVAFVFATHDSNLAGHQIGKLLTIHSMNRATLIPIGPALSGIHIGYNSRHNK